MGTRSLIENQHVERKRREIEGEGGVLIRVDDIESRELSDLRKTYFKVVNATTAPDHSMPYGDITIPYFESTKDGGYHSVSMAFHTWQDAEYFVVNTWDIDDPELVNLIVYGD